MHHASRRTLCWRAWRALTTPATAFRSPAIGQEPRGRSGTAASVEPTAGCRAATAGARRDDAVVQRSHSPTIVGYLGLHCRSHGSRLGLVGHQFGRGIHEAARHHRDLSSPDERERPRRRRHRPTRSAGSPVRPCTGWLAVRQSVAVPATRDAHAATTRREALSSNRRRESSGRRAREPPSRRPSPRARCLRFLSISDQHISVYNSSGLVTRTRVSTGMPGHRTPLGIYTIIGRERYHSSNIYSGAPMPFMQRITWSGVAMHLGVVPGYPASHGCIRLPSGSAERMWGLTRIGERLMIAPHEVAPSEFAHPLLPVPKLQMSPLATAENAAPKRTEVAAAGNDPIPLGSSKPLNPSEYAQALKARASIRHRRGGESAPGGGSAQGAAP